MVEGCANRGASDLIDGKAAAKGADARTLGKMKIQPYGYLLPALWLNILFGNQAWSPALLFVGQVFFWLGLLVAAFIVCHTFGRRGWPFVLLFFIVASRIASSAELPGFRAAYLVSMLMLFACAGVVLALRTPQLVYAQSRIFIAISLPIMFMQVAGVTEWLQVFNTLSSEIAPDGTVLRPEIQLLPLLLTPESELLTTRYWDFYQFLSMQSRPPGLTHSSAMLAVMILASAALHLGRMQGARVTVQDLVLVSVIVLSGAKLALLGFFALVFFAYVGYERVFRRRLLRVVGMLGMVLGVYALLFPVSVIHNFGPDAFRISFATRAVDALVATAPDMADLSALAGAINTYAVFAGHDREFGRLSGLATLIVLGPFLAIAGLIALPWFIRGYRYCRLVSVASGRSALLMIVVVVLVPFATPLFDAPLYALCAGVAAMPLAVGLSKPLRKRLHYLSERRARAIPYQITDQALAG